MSPLTKCRMQLPQSCRTSRMFVWVLMFTCSSQDLLVCRLDLFVCLLIFLFSLIFIQSPIAWNWMIRYHLHCCCGCWRFFLVVLKNQQHLVSDAVSASVALIGVLDRPVAGSSAVKSPFVELTT